MIFLKTQKQIFILTIDNPENYLKCDIKLNLILSGRHEKLNIPKKNYSWGLRKSNTHRKLRNTLRKSNTQNIFYERYKCICNQTFKEYLLVSIVVCY